MLLLNRSYLYISNKTGNLISIFFTQEAAFQKFIALAGGIGTVISLVPKFLAAGGSKSNEEKK